MMLMPRDETGLPCHRGEHRWQVHRARVDEVLVTDLPAPEIGGAAVRGELPRLVHPLRGVVARLVHAQQACVGLDEARHSCVRRLSSWGASVLDCQNCDREDDPIHRLEDLELTALPAKREYCDVLQRCEAKVVR